MNRRTLKKRIPQIAERLVTPTTKYLVATSKVHPHIISSYERQLEITVLDLMRVYLTLDRSWPHRERWLDGVSEEFTWEKKSGVVHGSGKLCWGHWPEVSREITGLSFKVSIQLCPRHSVDYLFRYGDTDTVRTHSSQRWCPLPARYNQRLQRTGMNERASIGNLTLPQVPPGR